MNAIFKRTSVRQFQQKKVEEEKIALLLKAAMQAPTAVNQQPWEFYVVEDSEMIQKLAQTSPYATPLNSAPLAFVICYRKDCRLLDYAEIDCSIASENVWLEAVELGLGTVMLGVAPMRERMDAVNEVLNLPENLEAFTIMPIGYPVSVNDQIDRFDANKIHRM